MPCSSTTSTLSTISSNPKFSHEIDTLSSLLSSVKPTPSQQRQLTAKKALSENGELAKQGSIAMKSRKHWLEKEQEKEKQEWLATYRKANEIKQIESELEKEKLERQPEKKKKKQGAIPYWEQSSYTDPRSRPEPGWILRILDSSAGRRVAIH
ncbi:hypothetical protein H072_1631 [Dactylellina haptotyla CBS 200.50]|uniref:Uncharacterized protein n=1 Tax=Dactylellina haptotyla (strain CBS 200.50) TaxID=1284197 RepID=S8ANG6_DACHA|nr:hypothetical protein H072_1631 [Dactylellina haptotyla CBS 200.50]